MNFKFLTLLLLTLLGIGLLAGCQKADPPKASASNVDYWTCTMHPSVHSKTPGKCPICSMDLVPVYEKDLNAKAETTPNGGPQMQNMPGMQSPTNGQGSTEFTVPVERQQRIGVTYARAKRRPLQLTIRAVGNLETDQSRTFEYTPRVDGYIQQLMITSPGQPVRKGEALVTTYSPEIMATEQQLAELLSQRAKGPSASASNLVNSTRQRLLLWGIDPRELDNLATTLKPTDQSILRSPFDGIVDDVPAKLGMAFKAGDRLFRIIDISHLWLWADFYENELNLLQPDQEVDITLEAFPGEKFSGRVAMISPSIDPVKRTVRVRIDLPNSSGQLRPGMFANVTTTIDQGQGLTIPVDAVLPTGARTLVFIDKGEGKLEPRFIRVGREFSQMDPQTDHLDRYYEVSSGLEEGDRIVSSANFLIDAEAQVQGAIKDFQAPPEAAQGTTMMDPEKLHRMGEEMYANLLQNYSNIQEELAHDSTSGLQESANKFLSVLRSIHEQLLDHVPDPTAYDAQLDELYVRTQKFHPSTLEEARIEFGAMSEKLIAMLKVYPEPLALSWDIVKCPMWNKSAASWIQQRGTISNPFLGRSMPECGSVEGSFKH